MIYIYIQSWDVDYIGVQISIYIYSNLQHIWIQLGDNNYLMGMSCDITPTTRSEKKSKVGIKSRKTKKIDLGTIRFKTCLVL